MVLDASLLNTQHYKVRIKGKVEQSREGVAPSPTLVAIEKGAFGLPSTVVANFTLLTLYYYFGLPENVLLKFIIIDMCKDGSVKSKKKKKKTYMLII